LIAAAEPAATLAGAEPGKIDLAQSRRETDGRARRARERRKAIPAAKVQNGRSIRLVGQQTIQERHDAIRENM
jgi:hypothetical protein